MVLGGDQLDGDLGAEGDLNFLAQDGQLGLPVGGGEAVALAGEAGEGLPAGPDGFSLGAGQAGLQIDGLGAGAEQCQLGGIPGWLEPSKEIHAGAVWAALSFTSSSAADQQGD